MKVVLEERYPWVVAVSRCGDKINVYISEDVPEGKAYLSNNGASSRTVPRMSRTRLGSLHKPDKVDKAIAKMQALADQINAAEAAANEKLFQLAQQEAGLA